MLSIRTRKTEPDVLQLHKTRGTHRLLNPPLLNPPFANSRAPCVQHQHHVGRRWEGRFRSSGCVYLEPGGAASDGRRVVSCRNVRCYVTCYMYIYIYIYTYTHVYTCVCIYIYIYIHTHIHIYIYICVTIRCVIVCCKSNILDVAWTLNYPGRGMLCMFCLLQFIIMLYININVCVYIYIYTYIYIYI